MRKLICALIGAAALVASATTYIQTSFTGTAPWRPVKDSVSQAHLADSARQADTARAAWKADSARTAWFAHAATYADSSRASGLADSAKRAGWAPLDSGRVRGIVGDTATALRTYIGSASTTGNAATATKLATARTISMTGDGTWSTSFDGSANDTGALTLASLLTAGSAGSATTVPTLTWDAKGRLTAVGSAAISIPYTQINDWSTATAGFQSTLGFTPIQQGGGTSMGGNKVYIGWGTDNVLRLQVDTTNFGSNWPINIGGTAALASSVAWTGVTGRPTALSSFTNDAGYLTANQSISLKGAVTGSGTTSIATSFANTHLAGINQDLTTTSSPTFGQASLGTWAPYSTFAWFGAAGQNAITNGNSGFLQLNSGNVYMCAPSGSTAEIQYNGNGYLRIGSFGVSILNDAPLLSVVPPSTFAGLITANGGISGNLTGLADSAKRAGWAPTDSVSVLGITSGAYVRKSGDTMSGALRLSGNYGSGIDFVRNQATYGGVRLWQYGDASTYEGVKFQAIDTSGGSSTLPVLVVADIFSGTFLGQGSSSFTGTTDFGGLLTMHASYLTTNSARTLSPYSGNLFVYTVSQTTTQTMQDGTVVGEVVIVKNAQNSSTLVLTGNINAGSSTITSLSTAVLVWNGSTWY